MSHATIIGLGIAAAVFFVIEAVFRAGGAALARITRPEAAEAFATGDNNGERIMGIVSKRSAAIRGLITLRIFFMALAAVFITLMLDDLMLTWWQASLIYLGIYILVQVIVGFISPQSIGERKPVQTLSLISRPLALVTRLTLMATPDREPAEEENSQLEEDQLAVMVERVSDSAVLDESDRELLQSVFDLNHTLVREVMVPRTDMVSISADLGINKALSLFNRSGFSRVPVVGETTDDLLGVCYLKDVLRRYLQGSYEEVKVRDIMRDPVFVPETKVIDELMRDMQSNQVHIALVVDEYGGIAGLVTIEDLVEELVGEISDEHDRTAPEVDKIDDDVFRVPARLPISDLGELFGIRLEDDDVDTVGGLFSKISGRVPIEGARVRVSGIELLADRFGGRRRRMLSVIARRVEEESDDE